jgi:vacuolar-type H+-ATPase catalytic subunit A/Vma1
MTDVISQYQKWKEQGESLRSQARHAMETRFRELLSEAVQIAEEYRADFGLTLKVSSPVTTFRYKASGKAKAKKAAKKVAPATAAPAAPPAAKPDAKIDRLQKRLTTVKKKLDEAKAENKPTRKLEDQVYEIEDELRLATQPVA